MTAKATLNGNITATGGENCDIRGFEWDADSGAPYANSWTELGSFGTGAFSHIVTGLPEATLIYYRAKAHNSQGYGYGGEQSFTTWQGIAASDSGAGMDSPSLQETAILSDSGAGADTVTAQDEDSVSTSDSGAGSESVALTEDTQISDSGAGAEALAVNDEIPLSDSGLGTDVFSLTDQIVAQETAVGIETILTIDGYFINVSDFGLGIDIAYLTQGEISLDDVALAHVLSISVEEPSIIQELPVMDALPHRRQRGKKGRSLRIQGWTDSPSTVEILRGYADGQKHLLLLPTGDSMSVHITDVQPPRYVQSYDRYDYTLIAVEVVD